jgi:hypothetical protein
MATTDLREIIKEEYKRSAVDPAYCLKKYGVIQHPIKGKVKFNLYPFQEITLANFIKHRFNIILKSRQMGISTLVAAYALWKMMFNPDYNVLVIATTQNVAKNLVQKVRLMHSKLPTWMRGQVIEDNKMALTLKNGSTIKAVSAATTAGRSEALSLLIIDEAAFIEKFEEIWTSAQMTLATGGDAILLSTPNGVGNLFHQIWVKAQSEETIEGLDKFNPIQLKWDLHPERDIVWRQQQDEILGPRQAAQECDTDFLSSGATVIEPQILNWYDNDSGYIKDPIEKRGPGGDLWIWQYPDYNKTYVSIVDTSRGDGSDYSTINIWDVERVEQVAEYKGKLTPTDLGIMAVNISSEYNNALLVIENTGIGMATVQVALDKHYKNLFYSYRNDPFLDDNIQLKKMHDLKLKEDMIPGFTNSHKSRPIVISKIETYISNKDVIIRSKRTMQELWTFLWINGRAESQRGYNDDLVFPIGIMLYVRDIALKLKQMGIEITKMAISKTFKSVYVPKRSGADQWRMQVGNKSEDLKWLL